VVDKITSEMNFHNYFECVNFFWILHCCANGLMAMRQTKSAKFQKFNLSRIKASDFLFGLKKIQYCYKILMYSNWSF